MRRLLFSVLLGMVPAAPAAGQQLAPPGTGGLAALDRALARLTQNRRLLLVSAHPDDEDTELLTLLSRGYGVDVAYLSLSRGEGGQNLIGPELGEALGLIRTGELMAARSVDGGRQFFTRGFDFGFSKSLAETERFWIRDSILADAIRVARRFRPQVLVSVFTGTARDGHGQHQMAGTIARQLFEALRDSTWGPRKLYLTRRFDSTGTTLRIPSGIVDPVDGRSFLQLAMASRSLHRSQDMGQLQRLGPSEVRLALVATAGGGGSERGAGGSGGGEGGGGSGADALFSGTDTALGPGMARYAALIDSARARLGPRQMGPVLSLLLAGLGELRRSGSAELRAAKEPILEEAIANAASIVVDASADDGRVVPGQTFGAGVSVWNAGGARVRVVDVTLQPPPGWRVAARGAGLATDGGQAGFFTAGRVPIYQFSVTVAEGAPLSEPYFLARPRIGGLYDWSDAADSLRGEPLDPPPLLAYVTLEVDGTVIRLEREVSHRFNDQARGETRRPLFVVPVVGVAVTPEVIVWPTNREVRRSLTVELVHGARGRTEGELRLELPEGWPPVSPARFLLEGEESRKAFVFEVGAPRDLRAGTRGIRALAVVGERRYDRATLPVDYPHIRPVTYLARAVVRVEAAPIALPALRNIGYVRGGADLVPEALAALGLPVTVLSQSDLERGDLARYDVIVIGSRAYETEPALPAANGRLLDWARAGGRLIVQYQQYQFIQGAFAPYPLSIARPHDRVTDESAPVEPLEPDHPLFRTPNRIGPGDWEGWVQERGLYFAREWDPAYRPLLQTGDNGERLRGGLLIAPLGRGLYVYTGLSFFRQLPAGVPGAFRLFVNLLALEPADVR